MGEGQRFENDLFVVGERADEALRANEGLVVVVVVHERARSEIIQRKTTSVLKLARERLVAPAIRTMVDAGRGETDATLADQCEASTTELARRNSNSVMKFFRSIAPRQQLHHSMQN